MHRLLLTTGWSTPAGVHSLYLLGGKSRLQPTAVFTSAAEAESTVAPTAPLKRCSTRLLIPQRLRGQHTRRRPRRIQRRNERNPNGHNRDENSILHSHGERHIIDGIHLGRERYQVIRP